MSPIRLAAVIAVVAVLPVACAPQDAPTTESSPVDTSTVAGLAASQVCRPSCAGPVYVVDTVADLNEPGFPDPNATLPDPMRQSISDALPDAVFIAVDQLDQTAEQVKSDGGTILRFRPPDVNQAGIASIDVFTTTRSDGFRGETYLFRRDGDRWVPTTPEDTGVTVTSTVS